LPRVHSPLFLSLRIAPEPALYRVVSVREMGDAADAIVEIGAVHHDPGKYARIDSGQPLPPAAVLPVPDFTTPLAAATAITITEAERRSYGALRHETHLSWQDSHAAAGTGPDQRIASWQIIGRGPDGTSLTHDSPVPQSLFTDLAPGRWRFSITAIGWTGGAA
jgi:predicted phage tail protein